MGGGDVAWYDGIVARLSDGNARWSSANEDVLRAPFEHLDANPGKEIRTKLIDAFNVWLEVPDASLQRIAHIVRRLHTASLLVDDVEDGSALRRGLPTAHRIYGVAQTINSANYVYFDVFAELQRMPDSGGHVERCVTEELVRLHRGQGMDLFWRDSLTCPSEREYVDMVLNKTGGLFRIAIKLMAANAARACVDLVPLVNTIGLLFQIRDDYMNLCDERLAQNKGFCEDLTEGKFSFPIIHAVQTGEATGDRRILHILRQRPTSTETKQYAVRHMASETRSFAYTRAVLASLQDQAQDEIARIERESGRENAALHAIVRALEVVSGGGGDACGADSDA